MHKWWHFIFININFHESRSTSYCGTILYHHYSKVVTECSHCKQMKVLIRDYKDSKEVEVPYGSFKEVNLKLIELKYNE